MKAVEIEEAILQLTDEPSGRVANRSWHSNVRVLLCPQHHDAAAVYKVDADAIALKVKQEFAAKEKTQTGKKTATKSQPKAVKRPKAV